MSDIILEKDGVEIEGPVIKCKASDFWLTRDLINAPNRCALRHDDGDSLAINYDQGYKGGVSIEGPVIKCKAMDFWLTRDLINAPNRCALRHDDGDSLAINYKKCYEGGVAIFGKVNIPDLNSLSSFGIKDDGGKIQKTITIENGTVFARSRSVFLQAGHPEQKEDVIDLVDEIRSLQKKVEALQKKAEDLDEFNKTLVICIKQLISSNGLKKEFVTKKCAQLFD